MSAPDPSASYAAEVVRLLWPEPWEPPYVTRTRHRPGADHRDAYLFPSGRRPRMLVPADLPGSASMVRRLGSGRPALLGPTRAVLERSVRSRAFPLVRWPMLRVPAAEAGAESVEDHLAQALGHDVRVGVLLGTRRVNQKPVLPVFDPDGRLRAYAKVGHNELTSTLVRREAAALTAVAQRHPRAFRAPRLLHHGRWCGLEVLVVSPLATDPRRPVPPAARRAAAREIAGLTRTTGPTLVGSDFWGRVRAAADDLAAEPDGGRLGAAVREVEDASGGQPVHLGGWHGDWGAWNMGMDGACVQVWDWERYDPAVPLGFDGLHFAAQSVRPGEREARRQEQAFLASVPSVLAGHGVPDERHDLTLRLYLVEVAARYVEALTYGATPALRRRTSWVLTLLERLLDPSPTTTEGRP